MASNASWQDGHVTYDDDEADKLFRLAHAALVPGGRLVTLDGVLIPHQNRVARFLVSRDRGEHVREEAGYRRIADKTFTKVKPSVRSDLLGIPYTHLILECEK